MKNNSNFYRCVLILCGLIVGLSACKKEIDDPPEVTIPEGYVLTIAQVRAMYTGETVNMHFDTTYSMYGVITMDDKTGNLYKTATIQDTSGSIALHFLSSGGVYEGDSVRVSLLGAVLTEYGGALQIDNLNPDRNIIKQATNVIIEPEPVSIADLVNISIEVFENKYESKLIRLENVEFDDVHIGQTYADAVAMESLDRTVKDCFNNEVILRTSGYSNFAAEPIPTGKGSFVAIASQYNETIQLTLRSLDEVHMDSNRCDGSSGTATILLSEDFSSIYPRDEIDFPGWKNIAESGSNLWYGEEDGSDKFAEFTSYYSTTGDTNIIWMITPGVNLDSTENEYFRFKTKDGYSGTSGTLNVYVSTSYDGSDTPWLSTWDQLQPTISEGTSLGMAIKWVNSGVMNLSNKTGTAYIAFKYTGIGGSDATTYWIDNITILGDQ